jgi:hypothetical protein
MTDNRILGCSAFGMADNVICVEDTGLENKKDSHDFCLSNIVLPDSPHGVIQTGDNARRNRIHTGLHWPPQARLGKKQALSRVPVSCLWHGLVEAGDRPARWLSRNHTDFSLTGILSSYVKNLLDKRQYRPMDKIVLAIPDSMDEFGQEALLLDLKKTGIENVHFLWRPVAAALSWLSEVDQGDTLSRNQMTEEYIIVVCLGPDGFEITHFQLKRVDWKDTFFIIPVRERPLSTIPITGFDWVAHCFESIMPGTDINEFWQAFTNFPHIWEAMAQTSISTEKIWSRQGAWTFWNPGELTRHHTTRANGSPNKRLRNLLGLSCRFLEYEDKNIDAMPAEALLEQMFLQKVEKLSRYRLRGIIVSGPLCPRKLPGWIASAERQLNEMGIDIRDISSSPEIDNIWLAHQQDVWADGCAEYGRRLDFELPTYEDTLPRLSMLAERRGEHVWMPLLNAETCLGGQPYRPDPIKNTFAIKAGAQSLKVYLKKDRLGGPEKNKNETPYRKAQFPLPVVPDQDMPVDVSIEIRPASGLAQVELTPSNSSGLQIFRGRRVLLDYNSMKPTDLPSPPKLGWPPLALIEIDPDVEFLENQKMTIESLLSQTYTVNEVSIFANELKEVITWKNQQFINGSFQSLPTIDQDGQAGTEKGNQIIDALAAKTDEYFAIVPKNFQRKYITRVTWLFAKTPEHIRKGMQPYLLRKTGNGSDWNYMVDAAGRAFNSKQEFQLLYDVILKRIRTNPNNPLPIYSARALWRVLSLRKDSPLYMEKSQAVAYVNESLKIMEQAALQNNQNFQKNFFQAAGLFLFLLRFRINDNKFLDADNIEDEELFGRVINCLKKAMNYFSRRPGSGSQRAQILLEGIKKFMYYEGSAEIIKILRTSLDENI